MRRWDQYDPSKFEVMVVDDIPWPGGSMKCPNKGIWADIAASTTLSPQERGAAFADRFRAMGDDEFTSCPEHAHDWAAIALLAVEVLRDPSLCLHDEEIRARAELRRLSAEGAHKVIALFADPIEVADGLIDGQHAVCCLKRAAAHECVVVHR